MNDMIYFISATGLWSSVMTLHPDFPESPQALDPKYAAG